MLAAKRTMSDDNEPAVKQSLLQKSGFRPPLRDLVTQPTATPEPTLLNRSRSLSSKRMLTPLLNKMPAQMASASDTGTRVKLWIESQQIVGSQGKPNSNNVCKPDLENMCTPLQMTAVHIPSDGPELEFKDENSENSYFMSDDVESIGLYSSFARSTPKAHDCLVIQKAVSSCSLNVHDFSVSPSEVPEKCLPSLPSTLLPREFTDLGLCQSEDVSNGPFSGLEIVPPFSSPLRTETEEKSFTAVAEHLMSSKKHNSEVNSTNNCQNFKVRSTLKGEEQQGLLGEESTLHGSVLDGPQQVLQKTTINMIPDQPCIVAESPLPQSDRVFVAFTGPLGKDGERDDALAMSTLISLLGEPPLDNRVTLEAQSLDSNASVQGALTLSVLPDALPGSAVERAVSQNGDGEVEYRPPLSDVITEGVPALTEINECCDLCLTGTREVVCLTSVHLQDSGGIFNNSSNVVSGQVSPKVRSSDLEEVPLFNCGVEEQAGVPLSTGTAVEGALLLGYSTMENVAESFICGMDGINHLCTVGENVCSVRSLPGSPLGLLPQKEAFCGISLSHLSASEKLNSKLGLHSSHTVLPPLEATELQLSRLDKNESLELLVNGGRKHAGIPQAKDETQFLQPKQCNLPTLAITPAETMTKYTFVPSKVDLTSELSVGMDGLNTPVQPADIPDKMVQNPQIPKHAFSAACQLTEDLELSTTISPQSVGNASLLSSCAVTCVLPAKNLDSSLDTISKLTDHRKSVPFPMCHQEVGTTMTPVSTVPAFTWVTPLALLERSLNTSMTEIIPPQQTCANKSPMSSSSAATWMTPIMIPKRNMDASTEFVSLAGKKDTCTQDSAVGTDSLLWNFSREHLSSVPRPELENRLENTLTIIEVLSHQLQVWQKNQGLDARLGPSEQRDICVQTEVTRTTQEQQHYYNLYSRAMERVQALQRCLSDEEQLSAALQNASRILHIQQDECDSIWMSAENIYLKSQQDQEVLSQQVCQMQALFADHMSVLKRMAAKTCDSLQQRDEMRSHMEKALSSKDAANACLSDLEIHSSTVISQLRRDTDSERELCIALQEACENRFNYQKEVVESVESSHTLIQKLQVDSHLMQAQCEESQELFHQYQRLMHQMTKRMQNLMQEQATMRSNMEQVNLEKQKVCNKLSVTISERHNATVKNEQLSLENTRLSAELASLMESLSELESDRDTLKEMVSEQFIQLSTKEESMVCVEQALKDKTARLKELELQIWQMSDVILGHEQALSQKQRENEAVQDKVQHLEQQQAFLQEELSQRNKRLKQMAELKTQLSAFAENTEFFEQESIVAREENAAFRLQVIDLESQLKANLETLRERSYQCELKKDEVTRLQKERENLQEELDFTKEEARSMLLKMGKELTESSFEVNQTKEKLLSLMGTLKTVLQGEDLGLPDVMDTRTPAHRSNRSVSRSCTQSVQKLNQDREKTPEDVNLITLGNGTSAFTKVHPATSKPAVTEQSLTSSVADLQSIITDLMTTISRLCHVKKEAICQLKEELANEKAKLESLTSSYNCDVEELKVENEAQKTQNHQQAEILNVRQQNVKQLQAMLQQQEERVLQLLSERKEVENLYAEISQLKRSLQLLETETEVLRNELSSRGESSAKAWVQEKILLQQEVTKLRLLLIDTENSKSEVLEKTMRHKQILEHNLQLSEQEVKKLDNIIDTIRETLLSIPEMVTGCKELEELVKYIG